MRLLMRVACLVVLLAPLAGLSQDNLKTPERLDAFRTLDANGDGWLSKTEAGKRAEVAASFEKADGNRDGRLSFAEFEKIALSGAPSRARRP
jgi:Ca2+-binding EF-hand superfamily protein